MLHSFCNLQTTQPGRQHARPNKQRSGIIRGECPCSGLTELSQVHLSQLSPLLSALFISSLPRGRLKCHELDWRDEICAGVTLIALNGAGMTLAGQPESSQGRQIFSDRGNFGVIILGLKKQERSENKYFQSVSPTQTVTQGPFVLSVLFFRFPVIRRFKTMFAGIYWFTVGQTF